MHEQLVAARIPRRYVPLPILGRDHQGRYAYLRAEVPCGSGTHTITIPVRSQPDDRKTGLLRQNVLRFIDRDPAPARHGAGPLAARLAHLHR